MHIYGEISKTVSLLSPRANLMWITEQDHCHSDKLTENILVTVR